MKTTFKKSETDFGCYVKTQVDILLPNEDFTIDDVLNTDILFIDKSWFVINNCDLTDEQKQQLAINIAYVVLPIFEEKYPDDDRPRKCLEVTQAYINGNATDDELRIACYDADDAGDDAHDDSYRAASYAASYAAMRVYCATSYAALAAKNSNNPEYYNSELNKTLKNFFNK